MKIQEMMDLNGKTALVTGGPGYLGSVMCSALIELGAKTVAVSRGKSPTYLDKLNDNNNFQLIKKDLSQKKGVDEFIEEVYSQYDCIDILINNSNTWPTIVNYLDQDWHDFEGTVNASIISQLYLTKFIFSDMKKKKSGNIINIASMYGKVSPDFRIYKEPGMGNAIEYGIAKAGMIQFTKYLASLGGKYNIRCNSISPGPFPRPGSFDGKEWFESALNDKIMLGRTGKREELIGATVFLATDLSSYVTGIDISVDGGWTAW